MTRREFIDGHKHELMGLLLDAALARRTGADLSLMLSQQQAKLLETLGRMFDQLQLDPPAEPPRPKDERPAVPANGGRR